MPRTKKVVDAEVKPKKTKKVVEDPGNDIPFIATDAKAHRKQKPKEKWPKVINGSHSVRIEHENGRIEFTTDWAKLEADVKKALRDYENSKVI